ncbi:aminopeptidase P family protein [Angustibacter sp. Root456]|uniref:aminopeptidase P family protein n=1 Tax=Angustibacter sp. Root456 TaxID=1736539 RepID=UPI0009EB1CCE
MSHVIEPTTETTAIPSEGDEAEASTQLHTGSHDLPVSAALERFMADDWATPATPDGGPREVAVWAAKRRSRLSEQFAGERVVVPSGSYLARSNDQDFRFRPHSDYVWLTGDQTSDCVLVLEPTAGGHDAILFLRPRAEREVSQEFWRDRQYGDFWAGRRPSLAESMAELGIECRHVDELPGLLRSPAPTRVRRGVDARVEAAAGDVRSRASLSQASLDGLDQELAATLSELRLVKDPFELTQLQAAVDSTIRGFRDVVAELPASRGLERGERWIEGTFWRRARLEGNDVGYTSIVAGGPHATTLHWIANDGAVRDGDLLLLDMGVETDELYTADITRTLPVSGRFTPLQRELYELVRAAQDAGIAAVRPGAAFRDFHHAAMNVMAHGLADLGLLPCSAEQALDPSSTIYRRWTLCGTGHMLGLDVHDCAQARAEQYLDGEIQPGHVLTVEPGLYLQADDLRLPEHLRGIGIRIEDDLVVTDDGARNMSAGLPRSPDAIEAWMGELLP